VKVNQDISKERLKRYNPKENKTKKAKNTEGVINELRQFLVTFQTINDEHLD
jgi:hypothetical protein